MSFNLQAIENELKEHAKVTARNALAAERQELTELMDHLKGLESGAAVQEGEAYLEKVTTQIRAKIEALKDNLQSEIAKVKLDIENCLQRIQEHKANSRGGSSSDQSDASATQNPPAAGVVAGSSGPAPAPAPATLDDAGVTTPTPPPATTAPGTSQS
jgi:gas vesicle protein